MDFLVVLCVILGCNKIDAEDKIWIFVHYKIK